MNNQPKEKKAHAVPARKRRSCLGCLGRGAILLAGLLAVLLAAGAIYQAASGASDLKKYPPPGKLYDVGDYKLHLYCTGAGSPSVILEAGAASPALVWYLVQEQVAKSTRVCSYDRAGFGWSEPASAPLSSDQVAADLHQLLKTADVPGPYILVGHSDGGIYVRSFVHQYPSEVVGMVLVDSSHESQNLRFPPGYMKFAGQQNATMKLFQLVSPFGVLRVTKIWRLLIPKAPLPADVGAAIWATMYRTTYCKAMNDETVAMARFLSQPEGPAGLGNLPLIVLSANDSITKTPETVVKAMGGDTFEKLVQVGWELQQELVNLSTQGKQVVVKDSGHYIQWDQPAVVIDAIREIMAQVRGGL
jgi:pimeloyl-ACP methyl ester carboxylesterase